MRGVLGLIGGGILLLAVAIGGPQGYSSSASAQVFTEPRATPTPQTRSRSRSRPTPAPVVRERAPVQEVQPQITFDDPALFCAANPNIEGTNASYVGMALPSWIAGAVVGMTGAVGTTQRDAYNWRCMDGRVLACSSSADGAACTRPSQALEPTAAILNHCRDNRNGTVPPAVAGNTVPIWTCRSGEPIISGYRSGVDPSGYFAENWVDVTAYAPSNMVGDVSGRFVGTWHTTFSHRPFLTRTTYDVYIEIRGGAINQKIATISYYSSGQSRQFFCSTDLFMVNGDPNILQTRERRAQLGADGRCPVQTRVTIQARGGQLFVEWRDDESDRVRLEGWAQRTQQ